MTAVAEPDVATFDDLVRGLDLASVPPCGNVDCEHGRPPAAWRRAMWCGCVILACDPCTVQFREFLAQYAAYRFAVVSCDLCKQHAHGVPVPEIVVRLEPIR